MATGTVGQKPGNILVPINNLMKSTKWLDVSSAITGNNSWSTSWARARFYADSAGKWFMEANFYGTCNDVNLITLTFESSIVFDNSAYRQPGVARGQDKNNTCHFFVSENSSTAYIDSRAPTYTNTAYTASCNVHLKQEPTTYTIAANMENSANIAAYIPFGQTGMPGEYALTGTTVRSGTGGYSYSVRSSTTVTGTPANVVSLTLNKGSYLVSAVVYMYSASAGTLSADIRIGGSAVTSSVGTATSSTQPGIISFTIPVTITADSTVVAAYASTNNTDNGRGHEMWAVRLAP